MRRLTRHPLARALRVDKLTLAALEATLTGPLPPLAAALAADPDSLFDRAERAVVPLAEAGSTPEWFVRERLSVAGALREWSCRARR